MPVNIKLIAGEIYILQRKIREALREKTAVLYTEEQYAKNDDTIYDGALVFIYEGNNTAFECIVMKIDKGLIHCKGIGDNYGESKEVGMYDINIEDLLQIVYNLPD